MRPVFLVSAAVASEAENGAREDANRLRRMDRFGRTGFLAGTRAFTASGTARPSGPDARGGVVVGTRHGCRPAITEHAARLAAAARVEDLAPSVFAVTVHNSVNGELAMTLGLGGVSETIVSGRSAGLEALILGARRVASGDADRMLVVAAEGIDDAMREAWAEERSALGPRAAGVELVETGASVLVEARETEEISSIETPPARYVSGTIFFEPDARRAAARFFEWAKDVEGRGAGDPVSQADITPCTPGYEDFLEGNGRNPPRIERFGAAGLYEIAREVAARRTDAADAVSPHFPSKEIRLYVTRDVSGAVAAVALEFFSSSQSLGPPGKTGARLTRRRSRNA